MHPGLLEMSYVGPSCLKEGKQHCINNRFKINANPLKHTNYRGHTHPRDVFFRVTTMGI